ncbi:MAG: hypothetical protein V4721_12430 [Bacteroidota bacterium]
MSKDLTTIPRYEMIEIIVPAGTVGQVPFPDVPNLRNQQDQEIVILDIEFFPVYAYGASYLNNTIPGTPFAELPKAAMILYVNGEESIRRIPLSKINYSQNAGVGATFEQERVPFAQLRKIDFPKSYVQFNAALVGLPYVMPFGITYLKYKQ